MVQGFRGSGVSVFQRFRVLGLRASGMRVLCLAPHGLGSWTFGFARMGLRSSA